MYRELLHKKKGLKTLEWLQNSKLKKDTFYRRKKQLSKQGYIIKNKTKFFPNIGNEFTDLFDDYSKDMYKVEKFIQDIPKLSMDDAFGDGYWCILLILFLKSKSEFWGFVGELPLPGEEKLFQHSEERLGEMVKKILNQLSQKNEEKTKEIVYLVSATFDAYLNNIIYD